MDNLLGCVYTGIRTSGTDDLYWLICNNAERRLKGELDGRGRLTLVLPPVISSSLVGDTKSEGISVYGQAN